MRSPKANSSTCSIGEPIYIILMREEQFSIGWWRFAVHKKGSGGIAPSLVGLFGKRLVSVGDKDQANPTIWLADTNAKAVPHPFMSTNMIAWPVFISLPLEIGINNVRSCHRKSPLWNVFVSRQSQGLSL